MRSVSQTWTAWFSYLHNSIYRHRRVDFARYLVGARLPYGLTRHPYPYNSQSPIATRSHQGKSQPNFSPDYNEGAILYFPSPPQLMFNIRVISEIVFRKTLGMASNPVAEV